MRSKTLLVSVLVIAVVITAVVGGTYAVFTDTESTHVRFKAGTIQIGVSGEVFEQLYLNPDGFNDWKPGDYDEFPLIIKNTGNNKAWIQIYIYETGPWVEGRPNFWDVAEHGVIDETGGTWNRWVLEPDEEMELELWVDFPQWVGNDYQGAQGDLMILVVAKQWRNKYEEGYQCVALEDKDDDWLPILGNDMEGIVCYKVDGQDLLLDVNAYGLVPGDYYQLSLNGTGGCSNFEDQSFATMPGDLYISGWYHYDGMLLHGACTEDWHEGVYNFTGTYGEVQASDAGSISWGGIISNLPAGGYDQVKFMVKHISGYTGDAPSQGDEGNQWDPVLMEMDYLNFAIPSP